MNKSELVSMISEKMDSSKVDAEKSLKAVTDSIMDALGKGAEVSLIGFGNFSVQQRAARDGRNPKTGEPLHIPAYKQPVFKAGKRMKEVCNN